MSLKDAYRNDLGACYLGEVVDINDPRKEGRVKIKVFGLFDELDTDSIPWATPGNNMTAGSESGGGSFSTPKKDSIVKVEFPNKDIYHPVFFGNQELSKEAKEEIENSYENAHILIYDTKTDGDLKIFFTEEKGLNLIYKKSKININKDKDIEISNDKNDIIEIKYSGNIKIKSRKKIDLDCKEATVKATDKIHLNCSRNASIKLGKLVTDKVILGDKFMTMFNSHTHSGNLSYPTGPPTPPMTSLLLSSVVKVQ